MTSAWDRTEGNFVFDEQRRRRPNVIKMCSNNIGFDGMVRVGLSEVRGLLRCRRLYLVHRRDVVVTAVRLVAK